MDLMSMLEHTCNNVPFIYLFMLLPCISYQFYRQASWLYMVCWRFYGELYCMTVGRTVMNSCVLPSERGTITYAKVTTFVV